MFCFEYSRTPGSRQPSPAEESLSRSATLLDPATQHSYHQHQHQHQHLQHMLNAGMEHHNNHSHSYHPQIMNHQMQGPVMNGVGGMQVTQVNILDINVIIRWSDFYIMLITMSVL